MTITQLREDERPREKLIANGARSLSNAELLAILVGSGAPGLTAVQLMGQVLDYYGGELSRLGAATIDELTGNTVTIDHDTGRRIVSKRFLGMGEAKAVTLLAACELGRRRQKEVVPERPKMACSMDMYKFWRDEEVHLQPTEGLYIMCLNNALRIIRHERLSSGGFTATQFDVRCILKAAILAEATHIAICHNHPSGSLRPSREDNEMTKRLAEACRTMTITFVDHLILTRNAYYSFKDEGKI